MKKILMRGGMSPLDNMTPEMVIQENSIGANSGNILYAYGVFRTLMTEETQIDMDYYGVERGYTDEDIFRINEEYDAYICPLADAFRDAFEQKLIKYADFFNKLTIPCYVIGLGLRASYEPMIDEPRPFDEAAKNFIKAVLNKSSIVGLRGEITGAYLKHLGFREDVDYTPIGCPSMYALGRQLSQRPLKLTPESTISFNLSSITPENIMRFAFNEMGYYPNHWLVEQNRDELKMLYYGIPYKPNQNASLLLPRDISDLLLKQNRYQIFINVPTWLTFMKRMDLSIGSKLHGNVAGVLAGCPALFLTLDSRMRELAEYHAFPNLPFEKVETCDTIEKLINKVDMTSHLHRQQQNFDYFIAFLNRNQLDHIYKDDLNRTTAPLDIAMEQIDYSYVESILQCTNEEVLRRMDLRDKDFRTTISKLKKNIAKKEVVLQQPAVKATLKLIEKHPILKRVIIRLAQ